MKSSKINWHQAIQPLLKKYGGRKHPLIHHNLYQLVVMVILSARATDKYLNELAPALFESFPNMKTLSLATEETLYPYIRKLPGFNKKATWLIELAKKVKTEKNIPKSMAELIKLPGIGRKSANVIMREAGFEAEGVIVDLHVLRIVPRLGIAEGDDPKIVEQQIMKVIPQIDWAETGMSLSFLGREICRPTKPFCPECAMNTVCKFYLNGLK